MKNGTVKVVALAFSNTHQRGEGGKRTTLQPILFFFLHHHRRRRPLYLFSTANLHSSSAFTQSVKFWQC